MVRDAGFPLSSLVGVAWCRGAWEEKGRVMAARRAKKSRRTDGHIVPLVLVHGLLGFGTIGPRRRLEYFRGVMQHLENNPKVLGGKAKVYVADLDPVDSIPSRAIQLRDFIQSRIYDHRRNKFRYQKVHVVAHSMGGLDARYMIANLSMDTGDRSPMAERVASLTTIGTPHSGTPFADFMMQLPIGQRAIQWANLYSINIAAFEHLTARYLVKERYNERMPDQESVQYFSYAGEVSPLRVFPLMLLSAEIIQHHAEGGPNDGLVPVESAVFRYGPIDAEYDQLLSADHAAQIGHGWGLAPSRLQRGFGHLDFYAHLANALARRVSRPRPIPATS